MAFSTREHRVIFVAVERAFRFRRDRSEWRRRPHDPADAGGVTGLRLIEVTLVADVERIARPGSERVTRATIARVLDIAASSVGCTVPVRRDVRTMAEAALRTLRPARGHRDQHAEQH